MPYYIAKLVQAEARHLSVHISIPVHVHMSTHMSTRMSTPTSTCMPTHGYKHVSTHAYPQYQVGIALFGGKITYDSVLLNTTNTTAGVGYDGTVSVLSLLSLIF